MAASPLNPKAFFRHSRSISLPNSRTNPLTVRVEEQLHTLRSSSDATTTSPVSTSFICHSLCGLKDLFERVDDLLQLPLIHATLANEGSDKFVNEVLDGSLRMLDICGTTVDVLLQMKECVQDLQSSLRRRRMVGNEFGHLSNEVGAYVVSRKKLNKVIRKCHEDLKRMNNMTSLLDRNHEVLVAIVGVLREVETVTLSVFGSILTFLDGSKAQSKPKGWSLVSKLMQTKRVTLSEGEDSDDIHEVEKTLSALISANKSSQKQCKDNEVIRVGNLLKRFEALELSIEELEEGLACVSRCLIKNRVTLLNSLNH